MINADLPTAYSRTDRRRYRQKVRRCLDVFAQMLAHFQFDEDKRMLGLELELDLIDTKGEPAMRNAEFLAGLCDPHFKAELGAYNLELNVAPRLIGGAGLAEYEQEVRACLARAARVADTMELDLALTGILPTLTPSHTVLDNISAHSRYQT